MQLPPDYVKKDEESYDNTQNIILDTEGLYST